MLTWRESLFWLQLFRMDIRTAARALMFHDQTRRHYERKSGPATLLNMALLQHTVELEWDNARCVGGWFGVAVTKRLQQSPTRVRIVVCDVTEICTKNWREWTCTKHPYCTFTMSGCDTWRSHALILWLSLLVSYARALFILADEVEYPRQRALRKAHALLESARLSDETGVRTCVSLYPAHTCCSCNVVLCGPSFACLLGQHEFDAAINFFFHWALIARPEDPTVLLNYALAQQCVCRNYELVSLVDIVGEKAARSHSVCV